jgi:hypothetical protein
MSPDQRRKFWAMVGDIAKQVPLIINGQPHMADKESWRLVFCAGLTGETRIADGINGEKVILGLRLRDIFAGLSPEDARRRASELIELVTAFAVQHDVEFSDPQEAAAVEAYEAQARG